jgi:hypothetical protein
VLDVLEGEAADRCYHIDCTSVSTGSSRFLVTDGGC